MIEELLDFDNNYKSDYDKYSYIRGRQLYLFLCKYLSKDKDTKIKYSYVRDLIRYDKRLKDKTPKEIKEYFLDLFREQFPKPD